MINKILISTLLALLFVITLCHAQTYTVNWVRQAPQSDGDANALVNPWGNDCVNNTSYQIGWMSGTANFGDVTAVASPDFEQAFVVKFSPNGTEEWVVVLNSTGPSRAYGISANEDGIVFSGWYNGDVLGWSDSQSEIPGPPETELTVGFVASILADGTPQTFQTVGNIDGSSSSAVKAVTTDQAGNFFVFGNFNGSLTLGLSNFTAEHGGIFFASYSSDNGLFTFSNITGEFGNNVVQDANTNEEGFSCVVGNFLGSEFNTVPQDETSEQASSFIIGIEPNGTIAFNTILIGALVSANHLSEFSHCSFVGLFNQTMSGDQIDTVTVPGIGGFVGRVDQHGLVTMFNTSSGTIDDEFNDITCDDSTGDCFITGSYISNITFGDTTLFGTDEDPDLILYKITSDGTVRNHLQGFGSAVGSNLCNTNQTAYVAAIFAHEFTVESFSLTSPSNISFAYFDWARSDSV